MKFTSRKTSHRASLREFHELQSGLRLLHIVGRNPQKFDILKNVSGKLQPGRFTLLLG